jgi:hypothetical protein
LINGTVKGKLKIFPNIEISGIGTTTVAASGRIIILPDVNKGILI